MKIKAKTKSRFWVIECSCGWTSDLARYAGAAEKAWEDHCEREGLRARLDAKFGTEAPW